MATRSTFVYSAAAVRRLMGLPSSVPVQIREFLDVIWVWVKGDRPTFISKTDFKHHFVERRKEDARELEVTDWLRDPPRYTVTNPNSGSQHVVSEYADRLDCDCEDYRWQQQFIGRGCCKHGYAVLQYLGFDSLKTFVEAGTTGLQTTLVLPTR
ncbi:SWIM zinc finger family protein [Oscillatoria sp. CS-180]|uniref:SWIM zinc finger family protein n=1 Tax=Oscillatoria sp. CS-180 TaxID=3021720 RepID=UPI00232BF866|nr:SWIM zinc finger family protein [Oscillatoria sp. CS-180]MDB9526906.1 SWIM zinc finger family protein [Oscillatoria sp. CS-180]